ncbi:ImmA/IrrE family metallo-endopeptidase [Prosthecobacter sp. SYSU 5D2]|uniref:ImmA/IrrE family metallo-endopeptidase n=1 Tax=Prosthecobacter sp. SYSU 5D2 TaxID=3134134 RepID=UPI0031FECD6D
MPATVPAASSEPIPANATKAAVDTYAGQVADALGYKPGINLDDLVARLGGRVEHDAWELSEGSGSLEVFPDGKPAFIIRLPYFAGRLRNRFTIAHELGHYFLHSNGGKNPIRIFREGSDRCEWEANWFAAGFLLPAGRFREDWTRLRSISGLADLYQVSQAVIEIRLKTLALG